MKRITFEEFYSRLKKINFDRFDLIVAIGSGGIIPAGLIQHILKIPLDILWINYRDENNKIHHDQPKLLKEFKEIKNKNILLVDDVSRTGSTLKKAKEIIKKNKIKTFVFNGNADYNIINQEECVLLPWK
ncbi:MAG: phosphoribosyltransferase [Nanoarchaeota archaeon]